MPYRPGTPHHQVRHRRSIERTAAAAQVKRVPYCVDCGSTEDLTAEHLVPVSQGGTADQGLTTLCRPCNIKRYQAMVR